MTFSAEQTLALNSPLSREHVATRTGAGSMRLSYIESHHAIREANRIFGFDGWSSETVDLRVIAEAPGSISYLARVRVTVFAGERMIVREGVGAGHGRGSNIGDAHEKASKEAESDAQKRALRHFGDQFGLALYDKTQANVTDAPSEEPARREPAPAALVSAPAAPSVRPEPAPVAAAAPAVQKPSGPNTDKPHSKDIANKLCDAFAKDYARLAHGSGNLSTAKLNFSRHADEARTAWQEMTGRDQARVKAARLKVAEVLAEHDAKKKQLAGETVNPVTGEISGAAA